MTFHGKNIIAGAVSAKGSESFSAYNPQTGEVLATSFFNPTKAEIDLAFAEADKAFDQFRQLSREKRAAFLDAIADEIVALGDALVQRAVLETGLPEGRIAGERGRTVGQLKMFAQVVRDGDFLDISIDTAQPERSPIPKPDIRMMNIPLGPVAIFGASNFPLAFSVAGGDTASALAAGCPVIVKAHPAHPGTSELVGMAIKSAAEKTGMPAGVFSLLHGNGFETGQLMVKNPYTRAVAFTGSFHGGKALFDLAASREEPIPCFAEMGSINPVFLLPDRLANNEELIARQYVDSINLGVGQFCTNPGIVFGIQGKSLDKFIAAATAALSASVGGTMLHRGIRDNFNKSVKATIAEGGVEVLAKGDGTGDCTGIPHLLKTTGREFIKNPNLQKEMFGPASIIVECADEAELMAATKNLSGNLTATLQATETDLKKSGWLIAAMERKVGRLLVNGFPTGVEVCHSMVHGGPYPATTDSRFTSVGASAIRRFLRPVCYQNFPEVILPSELHLENHQIPIRKTNGKYLS
ncbi:MAG: aldehyde dehydrogenase (NADP(+)) [Cyclobacteriaceae bacterium]|nr:aldehyde dehydrogenase (NADP(+)) [Cyclobacteriaceae bacterium]